MQVTNNSAVINIPSLLAALNGHPTIIQGSVYKS